MEVHDLDVLEPTKDAMAKIDLATARALRVVPVRIEGKRADGRDRRPVANASCLDELGFTVGLRDRRRDRRREI
jgi:hypothetical protein